MTNQMRLKSLYARYVEGIIVDTLIFFGLIGLVVVMWICIWQVGILLLPVGIVMTAISWGLLKEL